MTERPPRAQIIDVPEDAARTTFTVTPAPPQTVDHSTPPSVDVEISTERDGVEIVLMETLLADDVDRLIEALRVAKGLAVAESQAAGYFAPAGRGPARQLATAVSDGPGG